VSNTYIVIDDSSTYQLEERLTNISKSLSTKPCMFHNYERTLEAFGD